MTGVKLPQSLQKGLVAFTSAHLLGGCHGHGHRFHRAGSFRLRTQPSMCSVVFRSSYTTAIFYIFQHVLTTLLQIQYKGFSTSK